MKCQNCGFEFEGKFCPECGTPAEPVEQKCPVCGKVRQNNEKFCSECGYSYVQQQPSQLVQQQTVVMQPAGAVQPNSSSDMVAKVYKILSYVPACLFALLSVLMFIFYCAPVANFWGESLGNAYERVEDLPSLDGSLITLIIFAVIGFILAAVYVATLFLPALKIKKFNVAHKSVSLSTVLFIVTCLFMLIYFIIGCTICGIVSSEAEGTGFIEAGACPILIIVFSIIFLVFSAGAVAAEYFIGKKFPALKDEKEEKLNAVAEKYQADRAQRQGAEMAEQEVDTREGAPQPPSPVQRPKQVISAAACTAHKNMLARHIFNSILWMITGVAMILMVTLLEYDSIYITIFCIVGALLCAWGIAGLFRPYKNWGWKNTYARSNPLKRCVLTSFFAIIILSVAYLVPLLAGSDSILSISASEYYEYFYYYDYDFFGYASFGDNYVNTLFLVLPVQAVYTVVILMAIITAIAGSSMKKEARLAFYGSEKPAKGSPLLVNQDQIAQEYPIWREQKKLYSKYRLDGSAYSIAKGRYNRGKRDDKLTVAKPLAWLNLNKVCILICTIVLIIAIILVSVLVPIYTNIFRISKVSKIEIGDTQEQVEKILGEPYEEESTDYVWVYYSDEYMDILDEIYDLEEEMEDVSSESEFEKLWDKALTLEEKLETLEYKSITVYFELYSDTSSSRASSSSSSSKIYVVSSVWFDAACCESNDDDYKTLKSSDIIEIESFEQYSTTRSVEVVYEAEFKDGSYVKASATASRESTGIIEEDVGDTITVTWSDSWCKKYTGYTTVTENTTPYYIDGTTLYVLSSNFSLSSSEKTSIRSAVISDGVTTIASSAFEGCTSLTSVIV